MKAIIQRVLRSSVAVENEVISSIGKGITVLIGIHQNDTEKDVNYLVKKLLSVRLFEDDEGKRWMKSVTDLNYEILCISQFTLYHKLKGNKPDFRYAMKSEESKKLYELFLTKLRNNYKPDLIKDGRFGAMMEVSIVNDGPVTIELESEVKAGNETTPQQET